MDITSERENIFSETTLIILFVLETLFILWNIFMSFSFASAVKSNYQTEGFLGDDNDIFKIKKT